MAGVGYSAVGPLAVIVIGEADPDDASWEALVGWLESRPELRLLVVSRGGAPSAKQRQSLVDRVLKVRPVHAAVITESGVMRGAAAAMSWFLEAPIECFLPEERERALDALEALDRPRVLGAIAELEAKLSPPPTRPPGPPEG